MIVVMEKTATDDQSIISLNVFKISVSRPISFAGPNVRSLQPLGMNAKSK